jgi:hypothetical protein
MPFTKENASKYGKMGGRPKGLYAEKFRDYADSKGWKRLIDWCNDKDFDVAFPAIKFVFEMGYGKPQSIDLEPLTKPIQKLIDQNQALRIIQEMNFADRTGTGDRKAVVVGNGHPSVQAVSPPARGV